MTHSTKCCEREVSTLSFTTPFCHSGGIYYRAILDPYQDDKERVLFTSFFNEAGKNYP